MEKGNNKNKNRSRSNKKESSNSSLTIKNNSSLNFLELPNYQNSDLNLFNKPSYIIQSPEKKINTKMKIMKIQIIKMKNQKEKQITKEEKKMKYNAEIMNVNYVKKLIYHILHYILIAN